MSIRGLGDILREQGKAECAKVYEDSIPIYQHCGDKLGPAIAAFNLGHAYKNLPALRNLDEAGRWYQRSLELRAAGDRKGKGGCMAQLGLVAYERFGDAKKDLTPGPSPKGRGESGELEKTLLHHLNTAADYYRQALALLPPDAVDDLAVVHNQLGNTYHEAGDLERALEHYNQGIHYAESGGNLYEAGKYRFNVALTLANAGRLSDARLYAGAALRNFEPYGQGAAEMIEKTQGLIAEIERAMKNQ